MGLSSAIFGLDTQKIAERQAHVYFKVLADEHLNFFNPEFKRAAWTQRPLALHTPYIFKVQVETLADASSRYAIKVWQESDAEPDDWDLTTASHPLSLREGGLLLGSHHFACTFGNVQVDPL
jgi:hypothetical protein